MNIKNIFRKKKKEAPEPEPLKIDGVGEAPMTPEPDEVEVAAQALLEIMLKKQKKHKRHGWRKKHDKHKEQATSDGKDDSQDKFHDKAYYEKIADRIRQAYDASYHRALRFVSFCEEQLQDPNLPANGEKSLGLLEAELYKRIDVVDREEGNLKKRWQECLAEITLRLMNAAENGDDNKDEQKN